MTSLVMGVARSSGTGLSITQLVVCDIAFKLQLRGRVIDCEVQGIGISLGAKVDSKSH